MTFGLYLEGKDAVWGSWLLIKNPSVITRGAAGSTINKSDKWKNNSCHFSLWKYHFALFLPFTLSDCVCMMSAETIGVLFCCVWHVCVGDLCKPADKRKLPPVLFFRVVTLKHCISYLSAGQCSHRNLVEPESSRNSVRVNVTGFISQPQCRTTFPHHCSKQIYFST